MLLIKNNFFIFSIYYFKSELFILSQRHLSLFHGIQVVYKRWLICAANEDFYFNWNRNGKKNRTFFLFFSTFFKNLFNGLAVTAWVRQKELNYPIISKSFQHINKHPNLETLFGCLERFQIALLERKFNRTLLCR